VFVALCMLQCKVEFYVLENRVPKRMCGRKREERTVLRQLHDEELHHLYSSINVLT
jgi:hypothetical protein